MPGVSRHSYILHGIIALLMPLVMGCGNVAIQMMSGNGSKIQGLSASEDGKSFSSRCGGTADSFADPNSVILEQYFKSTPIIMKGVNSGISYEATLEASIYIKATGGGSTQSRKVSLVSIEAEDGGRFSRPKAEQAASDESAIKSSESMASGLLLKLQRTDQSFSGIECAVSFTAKLIEESATERGAVRFYPGIPTAVNPKAALETLKTELGQSRNFTARAEIIQARKNWATAGTAVDVSVSIKPITTDFKSVAGMPSNAPTITADIAYEIQNTIQGYEPYQFGLSKRQVYFISSKQLVAVLDDSGKLNSIDNKPLSPVLIVKSQ